MIKFEMAFLLSVLVLGSVFSSAFGEEQIAGDEEQTAGDEKWQFEFTPYVWAASADFDSTMSGITSEVDVSFKDVWDNLDEFDMVAFSGRFEAWKGDWGLFSDIQYVDVKYDEEFQPPIGIKLDMDIADNSLDVGAAYKIIKKPLGESGSRMFTLAPLGGLRYHYLKQETKLNGVKLGGDEDWVEAFVGVQIACELTQNFTVGAITDYGGFGIGTASDHTWNFVAGVDWMFWKQMSLKLGYKIFDIDYSRHSGNKKFGMDGKLHGPMLALTIRF